MRARDVVDRQVVQHREHVFLEDAGDLLQAGLPSFLQRQLAMCQPLVIDRFERVFARQHDGVALALAFGVRVDALGEQRAGSITKLARLLQGEGRVAAEGHAIALAAPREAEVPSLGAVGGNEEGEAVGIGQRVRFAGRLGLTNHEV